MMELEDFMEKKDWVVLGNTLDPEKYACRIKNALLESGCRVSAVGKELPSLDSVEGDIGVLDLCIHPVKGLEHLRGTRKRIGAVLIQPGASSDEIKALLDERNIPWLEGCALVGLRTFRGWEG